MSLGLASHIAFSPLLEEPLLKGEFVWQTDTVHNFEGVKIWLSSPPSKSKNGNKHRFFLQNEMKSRRLFLEFILKAAQSREVDFLYNDNEGVVEITIPKHSSGLFEDFLNELYQQNDAQTALAAHPLIHYWRLAAVNVYY